jgi:Glycosyl transferase family 90
MTLSDVVRAGNVFSRRVMDIDAKKTQMAKEDMERELTSYGAEFVRACGLGLDVSIAFCDVHALMNRHFHTQLSYVRLKANKCELLFHDQLIEFRDRNAGFVFVAKAWVLLMVIAEMISQAPDVRSEFVFEIGDTGSLDQVSFNSSHPGACLILDHQFAASNGYADFRSLCASAMVDWEARIPQVFWRGSTTGIRSHPAPGPGEADDLSWLPRLRFCKLVQSEGLQELCDVGVGAIVQIPEPHLIDRIERSGIVRARTAREYSMRYRGAFDIDGNANAWSGLFCSLLGASCVLKVGSPQGFRQWYYSGLHPWVHFIPVRSDLSDLREAVQWFTAHDVEAREIAARGRDLALAVDMKAAVASSAINLRRFCELHASRD